MKPDFTALGIDVGGTKIAAAIVHFPEGRIIAERTIPTAPARGSSAVLEDVLELAKGLLGNHHKIQAVGICVCELVSPAGEILSKATLEWNAATLGARFEKFGPVTIEADVRAAATAEGLFGAGRDLRVFLYVTVGTGISCCLMIDSHPYQGATGATGTMASGPLGWTCSNCGRIEDRAIEEIAAGPGIVASYNRAASTPAATPEEIFSRAAAGDELARQIVTRAGQALGSTVGLLINVLDPQAVIVGGGLGLAGGLYWDSFIASVRRSVWSNLHRDLPILQAATGKSAGVLGAAATAWLHASRGQLPKSSLKVNG